MYDEDLIDGEREREREREYHGYDFMLSLMIGSWQCTVQVSNMELSLQFSH